MLENSEKGQFIRTQCDVFFCLTISQKRNIYIDIKQIHAANPLIGEGGIRERILALKNDCKGELIFKIVVDSFSVSELIDHFYH